MDSTPVSNEEVRPWTTTQVVLATLFVVGVLLALWLIFQLRILVFLFFVAIVFGTAIRPSVEWLRRRGIPRNVGIIIIYILIAALLAGFLAMIVPILADQTVQFSRNLPGYYADIRESLFGSHNRLFQNIALRLPSQLSFSVNRHPTSEEMLGQVAQTLLYLNLSLKGLLGGLAIFLLAYYWTQESHLIIRALLRLFPADRRESIRDFFQLAEVRLGGYVRGQGLLSIIVGIAAFVAYMLIGLPFALVLAIIAGVMELIPVLGPALGAIPALLVALSLDSGKAVWVLAATGLIQLAENAWLVPRIMKDSIGVHPIIILLSLVAFGSVFGFVGALLALPLAALVHLLVNRAILSTNQTNEKALKSRENLQSMIHESNSLVEFICQDGKTGQSVLEQIAESDQLEIAAIAQELNQIQRQIEKEGGMTW